MSGGVSSCHRGVHMVILIVFLAQRLMMNLKVCDRLRYDSPDVSICDGLVFKPV